MHRSEADLAGRDAGEPDHETDGSRATAGQAPAPAHGSPLRRAAAVVAGHSWVRKAALSTPFVRDVAWRFVAGEDLGAGIAALRDLNARGVKGTLNHVGTHVHDAAGAVAAADAVVEAILRIGAEGVDSHVSVKLTQIGLDVDESLCRTQLRRVVEAAVSAGTFVRIDMEESAYVERTIRLFEEVRDAFGADRVGIVIQSYLRNRPDDLVRLVSHGSRIRIVKGGYWEPADVVFRAKGEIDAAFERDVVFLLEQGTLPALATHDNHVIDLARRQARAAGLGPDAFEFQMLYGVRQDLQESLVRDGYRVRCYVPYGGQWYEYVLGCVRRLPAGAVSRIAERVRGSARGSGERASRPDGRTLVHRRLPGAPTIKRGLDVAGALLGLVLLSPVLAWIALAVLVTQGRPIFFRQQRPGLGGRRFEIVKFRTMHPPRAGEAWFDSDSRRITRLGTFLRSTSLDELPELWNVLCGHMSLVGPRPLLVEYLDRYTAEERRRHEMRPGITGWAAINGRHALPFEDRLALDVWYIDHWSLGLDLRILVRTVLQVLHRQDVSATQDLAAIEFPERFRAALAGWAPPAEHPCDCIGEGKTGGAPGAFEAASGARGGETG